VSFSPGDWSSIRAGLPEFAASVYHENGQTRHGIFSALEAAATDVNALIDPLVHIHATGAGLSRRNPDQLVFKVFVLPSSPLFPPRMDWQGVAVEVEPLPVQQALETGVSNPRSIVRPLCGGVSIGPLGTAVSGSLGCLLKRDGKDELLLLSNNHVLTNLSAQTSGSICQPSPADGGAGLGSVVGIIADVVPLYLNSSELTDFDAATATLIDGTPAIRGTIIGIQYAPGNIASMNPGMRVVMSGRSSTSSIGVVNCIINSVRTSYGGNPPRLATMREAWQIDGVGGQPFARPGDSGGLVVGLETGGPLGLVFSTDGVLTHATELIGLCQRLKAWPV
jgi:hypothetical protein